MRDEEWNTWEGGWRIISRDKWHFCSPIYCIYPIRIANSVFHNKQTHTHTCGAQCIGEGMGIGGVRVWPCGADVEGLMGMVEWGWCLWLLRISATRLLRGLLLPSIYLHWTTVHCWNPCNCHRHKIYCTRQCEQDSIAVSIFVIILVDFDKYWNTESETSRLVYLKPPF